MDYKIVSDSAANLFSLPSVPFSCVPLKIITSCKEYADTPALDVAGMVEELKRHKGSSSTSCPNVHDWEQAFQGADAYFAVTITSALSGSCSAALQAAQDRDDVFVIDTLSAGPEMQLIIEKLQSLIMQQLPFQDICKAIQEYQKTTHLLFSLESLTNLARNGRVSPAAAKIAGVLGIRILGQASSEGLLELLHKCRGEQRVLSALYEQMKKTGFQGGRVRIVHCFNLPASEQLRELILADYPGCDVEILPCTALCSFYAEKGGILVGFEG